MDIRILEQPVPIDDRAGFPVEKSRSNYLQEDYGSILVFSSVEKWRWGARSISGNLSKILGIHWKELILIVREHLLGRNGAFCKERRD